MSVCLCACVSLTLSWVEKWIYRLKITAATLEFCVPRLALKTGQIGQRRSPQLSVKWIQFCFYKQNLWVFAHYWQDIRDGRLNFSTFTLRETQSHKSLNFLFWGFMLVNHNVNETACSKLFCIFLKWRYIIYRDMR